MPRQTSDKGSPMRSIPRHERQPKGVRTCDTYLVRGAQAAFSENDAAAALVLTTDQYSYSDPWHYDSAGFLDLGREFAESLNTLKTR